MDNPGNEKYVSCRMSFGDLQLSVGDRFSFLYDFGDQHSFDMAIIAVNQPPAERPLPYLLKAMGDDIKQYSSSCMETYESAGTLPEPGQIITSYHKYQYYNQVRFITEENVNLLEQWRKSNDKRKWQKAVAILDWQLSMEELSQKIEISPRRIRRWISTFDKYGIEALAKPRKKQETSKKRVLVEQKTRRLLEILHQQPRLFGINRSNWNQPSLSAVYEKEFGEPIGRSTVSRLIRNSGYKFKKAKRVLTSSDPDYREKVDLLLKILNSLKPNEKFFFVDEMGPVRVKKHGGRGYTQTGEQLTVPKVQQPKGSVTLAAALSATTNQIVWVYGKAKDTASMIDLIEILFNQYHEESRLYITWDAASWHGSEALVEWLDSFNTQTTDSGWGPVIEFVPLPTSSQFLNVIEAVFSGMKRAVIHLSNYRSEEEMKAAISQHFRERNAYFKENPKRAGKKIWDIDFFKDYNNMKSGNYREW